MPPERWLILADDLTGAAETAMAFARAGWSASVAWGDAAPHDAVLARDAASRRLDASGAAVRHRALLEDDRVAGRALFKKIDSTLRGQPAAELAASLALLRDRGRRMLAVVAPAFPSQGRTVEGGSVRLHSRALEESALWAQEHSYASADLREVLAGAGLRVRHAPLSVVRDAARLHLAVSEALGAEADALICDALTEVDLTAIVQAGSAPAMQVLWVGSAGLARALADAFPPLQAAAAPTPMPRTAGGILVVVGSLAEVSRAGAARLAEEPSVLLLDLEPAMLRAGAEDPRWHAAAAAAREALATGRDVAARIAATPIDGEVTGPLLAQRVAELMRPVVAHAGGLIATGGETALALLDAFGASGIRMLEEIEPAVPLGLIRGARSLPVVTKAGAFGDVGTLAHCLAHLKGLRDNARPRDPGPGSNEPQPSSGTVPMNTSHDARPVIAITMGDASGIGPEIIMKAMTRDDVHALCRPLVIGDAVRLREAGAVTGVGLDVAVRAAPREARYRRDTVDCIDLGLIPTGHPFGVLSPICGEAAFRYVERAARLVGAGEADAICTAPLSKEALHAAGHKYPGHTELLAHLTGTPEVSMMLVAPKLRVIHVTTHIGLIDAIARIEPGLVERVIDRGRATLVRSGIAEPRIGVCGINPHAGENGLFGRGEEEEKIVPAVQACLAKGWAVTGPLPADTLFFRAARGDFDLVVAMYHDQGHAPVKVMGLEAGVNITIGLPVVRTSVDHGTAFDIAGKGIADERSLVEALRQAADLSPRRHRAEAI